MPMLSLKADAKAVNNSGETAFLCALLGGQTERVREFKKSGLYGTEPEKINIAGKTTDIFEAVNKGSTADTAAILDIRPDLANAKNIVFGSSPLHIASAKGNDEIVNLLIKKGADVNIQNDYLRTPLHSAASSGRLETAKILVGSKANVFVLDARGNTPLHDAAAGGHKKLYDYLLECGASDSNRNNAGETAAFLLERSAGK